MQYSDYLTQIAALIKQNPSITVREIASELQFADSKSVYYWLEKGNFKGINEFKRQVLKSKLDQEPETSLEVDGIPHYLVTLPLMAWDAKEKDPVGQWSYLHTQPKSQGLFALRVGTNSFGPWFLQDDILIVTKQDLVEDGAWVLLQTIQGYSLGKVLHKQAINPLTLKSYSPSHVIVGTILNQERCLTP